MKCEVVFSVVLTMCRLIIRVFDSGKQAQKDSK